MNFLDKARARIAPVVSMLDSIGFVWLWLLVSLLLLAGVAAINPARVGSYLWFMSKLSGAAALGYGFDLAFFRGSDPRSMSPGLEQNLAQTRRVTLIAAAIIGAGLIG